MISAKVVRISVVYSCFIFSLTFEVEMLNSDMGYEPHFLIGLIASKSQMMLSQLWYTKSNKRQM